MSWVTPDYWAPLVSSRAICCKCVYNTKPNPKQKGKLETALFLAHLFVILL